MAREDGEGRLVAAVSGEQVISKVSGELVVSRISGQAIVVSGQLIPISGAIYAEVSGQVISKVSGEQVISKISGEAIRVSGQLVPVSGAIYAEISGQVVAKVSGEIVRISGQVVNVSGAVVGVSGQIDIMPPTYVRSRHFLFPSAASGGTVLESGAIRSVTIKSLSGDVLVGGTGNESPCSGFGFLLAAGEALTYDLDNFNRVRIMARTTSGDWVTYTSVDIT